MEQVDKVLTDILRVKVLEASEFLAVKKNRYGDDLGIGKPSKNILESRLMIIFFRSSQKDVEKLFILIPIILILPNFYVIVHSAVC